MFYAKNITHRETDAHHVFRFLRFLFVALSQTSSLAPELFQEETALTQASPPLAFPGKVPTHSHSGGQTVQ